MYVESIQSKKITKDTIVLMMGLFYPAVHNYIWRILVAFSGILGIYFSNAVFDIAVWFLVLGYIVVTSRKPKMSIKTAIIALAFILITLSSYAFTSYDYFSLSVLITLLIGTFSFFFQGYFVNIRRVSHTHLFWGAIITLSISILYSVYSVGTKDMNLEDNMEFAYIILPSILIILSQNFTDNKNTIAIIFSVIGTIFLVLQGTRGPILCLAFFICLMIYKKHGTGKLFYRTTAVILAVILIFSIPFVQQNLLELSASIDSSGYSSRFIRMILKGELSDANGRDAIKELLLKDIANNPLKIRGMFADRHATRGLIDNEYNTVYKNGTYAHSIWLEMIYNWGVFAGIAIFGILVYALWNMFRKTNKNNAYIAILFICTGFVHLFLSGSYLQSNAFFFLVGLVLNRSIYTKHDDAEFS